MPTESEQGQALDSQSGSNSSNTQDQQCMGRRRAVTREDRVPAESAAGSAAGSAARSHNGDAEGEENEDERADQDESARIQRHIHRIHSGLVAEQLRVQVRTKHA